jgi:hypothetical protein
VPVLEVVDDLMRAIFEDERKGFHLLRVEYLE